MLNLITEGGAAAVLSLALFIVAVVAVARRRGGEAGEPEVERVGAVHGIDDEVVGLDVAVDEPGCVDRGEGLGEVEHVLQRCSPRHRRA
jgi:hypothetical protein